MKYNTQTNQIFYKNNFIHTYLVFFLLYMGFGIGFKIHKHFVQQAESYNKLSFHAVYVNWVKLSNKQSQGKKTK